MSNKQYRNLSILVIVVIATILVLSTFNIYPGGYSIDSEKSEEFSIVKNNLFENENIEITNNKENELKILLIKDEITNLKLLWILSSIVILLLTLLMIFYLKNNSKQHFYISTILLIMVLVSSIYLYSFKLNNIETYISLLT